LDRIDQHNKRAKANGIELGKQAAAATLSLRSDDGSQRPDPLMGVGFKPSKQPGYWRQDPISKGPLALGAYWGEVRPFVMEASDQFRVPPPPPMDSPEYTAAYNEVKALGGDGITTPTVRTEEQREIGIYWVYDGTPSLCAPPLLYNRWPCILPTRRARVRTSLNRRGCWRWFNVSLADAAIAVRESKYHYQFWRPVTALNLGPDHRLIRAGKGRWKI
jgi:hypothetical protein